MFLKHLAALVLACASGATAVADDPAAHACGRFALEKIPLGASKAEVEALKIGTLEAVTIGMDNAHYKLRPPHTRKEIALTFKYDRVVDIEFFEYANNATAETFLADLKSRWGEPDKPTESKTPKPPRMGAKYFTWSERACPAYGAYYADGNIVRSVLTTSVNRISVPDESIEHAR